MYAFEEVKPLGHLALCCFIHGPLAINIESFKKKLCKSVFLIRCFAQKLIRG